MKKIASLLDWIIEHPGLSGIDEFVYYLMNAHPHSTVEELLESFKRNVGKKAEEVAMTIAAKLKEEGRKEGREKGREEGREEGREQLLELATSVLGADSPAVDELRAIESLEVLRKRLAELLKAH